MENPVRTTRANTESEFKLFEEGFDQSTIDDAVGRYADTNFWRVNGASQHAEAAIADTLFANFSTFEGCVGVSEVSKGCGAGGRVADLNFSAGITKVLDRIQSLLDEAGLVHQFPTHGVSTYYGINQEHFPDDLVVRDPSYCDDVAYILFCSPDAVCETIQCAFRIIWREFTLARLFLNFATVKSAAMVEWHGHKADVYRREVAMNRNNRLPVTNGVSHGFLDIVASYKHIGSVSNCKGQIAPDVARRCGIAFSDFRVFRRKIFANPDITTAAKSRVVKPIVVIPLL